MLEPNENLFVLTLWAADGGVSKIILLANQTKMKLIKATKLVLLQSPQLHTTKKKT